MKAIAGSDKAWLVKHVSGKEIELPEANELNKGVPGAHPLSGAEFGKAVAESNKDGLVEHVSGGRVGKP